MLKLMGSGTLETETEEIVIDNKQLDNIVAP